MLSKNITTLRSLVRPLSNFCTKVNIPSDITVNHDLILYNRYQIDGLISECNLCYNEYHKKMSNIQLEIQYFAKCYTSLITDSMIQMRKQTNYIEASKTYSIVLMSKYIKNQVDMMDSILTLVYKQVELLSQIKRLGGVSERLTDDTMRKMIDCSSIDNLDATIMEAMLEIDYMINRLIRVICRMEPTNATLRLYKFANTFKQNNSDFAEPTPGDYTGNKTILKEYFKLLNIEENMSNKWIYYLS